MERSGWETRRWIPGMLMAMLAAAIVAAYWQVGGYGFVTYDDDVYVTNEPMINQGVRPAAILWAFTAFHGGNWHPLTSFSHMLDCTLFGLSPAGPHWENVMWHVLNTCLVFAVWWRMTKVLWPSVLVAAFFALHPVHVESVAWISERKDVLSAFFWLLGLAAYLHYIEAPSRRRYGAVFLCLAAALLAKPMPVTFPCVLLLLDFWPLRRWREKEPGALFREKIPLFLLAGFFSAMTYLAQRFSGAMEFGDQLGFGARAGNAAISYARYLGKIFWPDSLAVLYSHPEAWPFGEVLAAGALLLGITWMAGRWASQKPWLLFGWLWFLGTLVPVIGLVQVGQQAMADRYLYMPMMGIVVAVIWEGRQFAGRAPRLAFVLSVSLLAACFFLATNQLMYWQDSIRLIRRAVAVNDHVSTRLTLADTLAAMKRPEEEVAAEARRAGELDPGNVGVLMRLSSVAVRQQRYGEARSYLEEAVQLKPRHVGVRHDLGMVYYWMREPEKAKQHFDEALRLSRRQGNTRLALARYYFERGDLGEARFQLEEAIRLNRWDYEAHAKLGFVLGQQGEILEARKYLHRALWIHPGWAEAAEYLQAFPSEGNLRD
jgi:tetratricopeptide (TPR) repeat protein